MLVFWYYPYPYVGKYSIKEIRDCPSQENVEYNTATMETCGYIPNGYIIRVYTLPVNKLDKIPAKMILICDKSNGLTGRKSGFDTITYWDRIARRHYGGLNILCVDSHVSWLKKENITTEIVLF